MNRLQRWELVDVGGAYTPWREMQRVPIEELEGPKLGTYTYWDDSEYWVNAEEVNKLEKEIEKLKTELERAQERLEEHD